MSNQPPIQKKTPSEILEILKKELQSDLDAYSDPWSGYTSDEVLARKGKVEYILERIKELEQ